MDLGPRDVFHLVVGAPGGVFLALSVWARNELIPGALYDVLDVVAWTLVFGWIGIKVMTRSASVEASGR